MDQDSTTPYSPANRLRPRSPNIQIYRPQLTSVLSIVNRISGVLLSVCALGLVIWLIAAAAGPQAYAVVREGIASWAGRAVLFVATFAFFMHLCGSLRHLIWDTVHGFSLRAIYLSGWIVFAASMVLTVAAWVTSAWIRR
ncbi:MAG: succinate dehydrogenase, cytochrome b556 subunit [Rhodanobacteraceae bacterium]